MKIRKAKLEDLDSLIELWEGYENFEESFVNLEKQSYVKKRGDAEKNMRENFKKVLKGKKSDIFVAEESNEIAGFILISKSKSDDIHTFDFYGEIPYIYIKKDFRGKGIGSKFFKKAKKWFKDKKLKYIKLDVNVKNKKAKEIYKKWGFDEYEVGMWKVLKKLKN